MMNSKVETTALMAEPFHVDFSGHLTMGVLGNHLLNCAGVHAASRGFGMAELNESKYTSSIRPEISSFGVPLYDLGAISMRLMTKMLKEETVEEKEKCLNALYSPKQTTKE